MRNTFLIVLLVTFLQSCAQNSHTTKTVLTHYNPANAIEKNMPPDLREISGITFTNNDSIIYAEQDELGNVYAFNTNTNQTSKVYSLGIKGDFEDIVYSNGIFYLLRSDGRIFTFSSESMAQTTNYTEFENIVPKAEYEGLYYQKKSNSLFLLAKTIPEKEMGIIYQLGVDNAGQIKNNKTIKLNTKDWKHVLGYTINHFRPSAISFSGIDNQWFILSSVNHLLLTFDVNWQLLDYADLDVKKYPQPEGMAFDNKGNLWIASEAGNKKYGKLYKIERN